MKSNSTKKSSKDSALLVRKQKRRALASKILNLVIITQLLAISWLVGSYLWRNNKNRLDNVPILSKAVEDKKLPQGGEILSVQNPTVFSKEQTDGLIKQADKTFSLSIQNGVTKQVFSYSSYDARDNSKITVYGRIYVPSGQVFYNKLPLVAFAPGTTGIDDRCAASIEDPAKRNWANYDSLLAAYASQGFIVVTTDYEGMRDNERIHHYMVGEQEGRAVLDSVRATKNLSLSRDIIDDKRIALAGYSQGGHAALWGDRLRASYADELSIKAVVGFGPVTSVSQTLADNVNGANINWFGPYLLTSYADYYKKTYPIDQILLARWTASLKTEVLNSCIDTVLKQWPTNPAGVYTPSFITQMQNNYPIGEGGYNGFIGDMYKNNIGNEFTQSAKLINHGQLDNVVLSSQSARYFKAACAKQQKITYQIYPTATHYNTMALSFRDTLGWLQRAYNGKAESNCT